MDPHISFHSYHRIVQYLFILFCTNLLTLSICTKRSTESGFPFFPLILFTHLAGFLPCVAWKLCKGKSKTSWKASSKDDDGDVGDVSVWWCAWWCVWLCASWWCMMVWHGVHDGMTLMSCFHDWKPTISFWLYFRIFKEYSLVLWQEIYLMTYR